MTETSDRVELIAATMISSMFAPHELPVSDEIRRNYLRVAGLVDAALPAVPSPEPVAWRYGRKDWNREIWRYVPSAGKPPFEAPDDWIVEPLYGAPVQQPEGPQAHGIYIASKTRHADRWRAMRAAGVPIISTWIDEAGEGQSADLHDLWERCILESKGCKVLIAYREPEDVFKGAWVEIGAALASGVPVYAVGLDDFTISNYRSIRHFKTIEDAFAAALAAVASPVKKLHDASTGDTFYQDSAGNCFEVSSPLPQAREEFAENANWSAALADAARGLVQNMSGTFKARNGRQVGVEADDGEKCWIVHSEDIAALQAALAALPSSPAPRPVPGSDAHMFLAENANLRETRKALQRLVDIVWQHATESTAVPSTKTADMLIALAALPSSPAPRISQDSVTEQLPEREPVGGAGEATQQCAECNCANPPTGCTWIESGDPVPQAVLAEDCAKIAEGHVGAANHCIDAFGYDEACRDIAKAIRDAHGARP